MSLCLLSIPLQMSVVKPKADSSVEKHTKAVVLNNKDVKPDGGVNGVNKITNQLVFHASKHVNKKVGQFALQIHKQGKLFAVQKINVMLKKVFLIKQNKSSIKLPLMTKLFHQIAKTELKLILETVSKTLISVWYQLK